MHDYQEACMAKLEAFLKKVPVKRLKSEELPTIVERPGSECNSVSSVMTVEEVAQEDVILRRPRSNPRENRKRSTASGIFDAINSIVDNF